MKTETSETTTDIADTSAASEISTDATTASDPTRHTDATPETGTGEDGSATSSTSTTTPSGQARVVKKRRGTASRKSASTKNARARSKSKTRSTAGQTTTRSTAGRLGIALLAVVAIAAVALAIVFGLMLKNRVDTDNAGQEALRTARDYAVALTSIDTANLDRDFGRVLDGATGEFKDMYSNSSSQLRQLLVDNQATGKGTVVDAGIKSQGENKVEVLLFVDQTVTNTASPDPRIDRSRIVMTMEKIDGRWLASKVELP